MVLCNVVKNPWSPVCIAARANVCERLLFFYLVTFRQRNIYSSTFRFMPLQMPVLHFFEAILACFKLWVFFFCHPASLLHKKYINSKSSRTLLMWFWHILWASYDFLKPSYLFFFFYHPAASIKNSNHQECFWCGFWIIFELHLIFWSFLNIFAGIVFFEKMGKKMPRTRWFKTKLEEICMKSAF